jgi:hypothetical protein
VFCNNIVIYSISNTTCIGNQFKKIRRLVSVHWNHHQAKYKKQSTGTFSECAHSLNVPVLWFCIWSDDGSIKPKHVAEFLILITNIGCIID